MTETTDQATTPNDSPAGEAWQEQFKRQWMQLKMGFEGMMLDKIMRQNQIARDIAQRTADGTLGQPLPKGESVEDDMGIRIGDEQHTHYHTTPQATQGSALSKVALGASLLSTGGMAGVLGAMLMNEPTPVVVEPSPPAIVQPSADSDTKYGLEVYSTPPEQ
jgi:hypothetical protein